MATVRTKNARDEREKLRWKFAFTVLFGGEQSPLYYTGAAISKYIWHRLQMEEQFTNLYLGDPDVKEMADRMCVNFAFENFLTTDEKIDVWKRADLMAETHLRFWNSDERNAA